jgi:hypothetical protein
MIRMRRWIAIVIAVVLVLGVAAAVMGVMWEHRVSTAAAIGKAQITAGAQALSQQDAVTATSKFKAASAAFESAKRDLGPQWVAGLVLRIPWAGRQYAAAQTLLAIGIDGSSAGIQLADVLGSTPKGSAAKSAANRFAVMLAAGHSNVEGALTLLTDAADRADGLSTAGLLPQLAKPATTAKSALSAATPFLKRSHALLQLESYLFSGNHRILVISQDGAELRPTGGFPGSFGIVDVGSDGVRLESYEDVYTLPILPGVVTPPRGAAMALNFSFRDANWWIDFPTSARRMLEFWKGYHRPAVDGLVAIDTVAMRDLLAELGPVDVPSYSTTFTSANLLDKLLFLVEIKAQPVSAKKGVLTALAAELEKRLLDARPTALGKSAVALGKAADAKHIQMYFTDPSAQAAADALRWSGRVAPPSGTTDVVAVSNAMTHPGKVNLAMSKTIDYAVALFADRSAETTLVLGYGNTAPYPAHLPSKFTDWLRVYRAPGTVLPSRTPDGTRTIVLSEFGFPAEARTFSLERQQSDIETLVARVPDAVVAVSARGATGGSAAKATAYRLHFVRQDDLTDLPLTVAVSAPRGWNVTGASARLSASGAALPVSTSQNSARLEVPLTGDLDLEVLLAPN